MDSTILYRPTLEEQHFFDEVRRHIDRHRDDFREAGQWLETEYAIEQVDQREREGRPGDPANYQQAHEEMERGYRAAGYRTKERSPESVRFAVPVVLTRWTWRVVCLCDLTPGEARRYTSASLDVIVMVVALSQGRMPASVTSRGMIVRKYVANEQLGRSHGRECKCN